jgi:hypothetical protein
VKEQGTWGSMVRKQFHKHTQKKGIKTRAANKIKDIWLRTSQ